MKGVAVVNFRWLPINLQESSDEELEMVIKSGPELNIRDPSIAPGERSTVRCPFAPLDLGIIVFAFLGGTEL